jgi:acetylornithine deacetylase/succinyl-diaminopimelate desuccinylase-like protein
MEKYYPTWVVEKSHPGVQAAVETCRQLTGSAPTVDKWTFSTNGVGTMGTCGVPTIGYGPGDEADAHTAGERVAIDHLVQAAQFYAAFPLIYVHTIEKTKIAASAK